MQVLFTHLSNYFTCLCKCLLIRVNYHLLIRVSLLFFCVNFEMERKKI
jgi:hypothetical protein